MARTSRRTTIRRPTGTIVGKRKKPAKKVEPPAKVLVKCHFCERKVDEGEFRCEGCGEVVCDQCDELSPWGRHEPFEHTAEGVETEGLDD